MQRDEIKWHHAVAKSNPFLAKAHDTKAFIKQSDAKKIVKSFVSFFAYTKSIPLQPI